MNVSIDRAAQLSVRPRSRPPTPCNPTFARSSRRMKLRLLGPSTRDAEWDGGTERERLRRGQRLDSRASERVRARRLPLIIIAMHPCVIRVQDGEEGGVTYTT